jgi:hypothetical protein
VGEPAGNGWLYPEVLISRTVIPWAYIASAHATDGFFNLRRNPHSAPRNVLPKVNLIQRPEVYVWLQGQLSKFFYALLVEVDQHGR